ncbi:ImmA/IrrE family metallo-endopeptidase [Clostridium perfringens]|uniref:ImmA/IrrE family metallo-endopeptidase n=1 Tax=Clostridium perfringens TaxID=1502 RepID=UPI0023F91D98|nr:ImmA/IrrE family metallo-endopeptidase [Clostridium perfringens]WEV20272.1 ArdC-like ssDNA-binding domain-containing protein [Clostridium perfringens D]
MAYKKKEYKSSKSQEEKRKDIDLLVKQADEKIDKVFSSPNDLKEYLSFMAKFHNYSYRNSILIEEQFRGAVAVGSFAFWKEKGYSVNKGEKGIKILVLTKIGDRFIAEDGTMKLISKASEKEKQLIKSGELETLEGAIKFKQGYVFDVSQTNMPSSELPKIFPNKWLEGDVKNYKGFYKSLENVASKIGVKIIEPKSELGLVKGVSYTSTREVALNPRNSELQNVKTLIHELAHAKLHTVETRDNYTKAEKEFQAEMVALSVSSYFGINTEEYSLRYLSEWTKNATFKDKEKLLKEVSTTVKEYVEIMEDSLNTERELTKENELVNSLFDKNIKNESELNLEMEGEMGFENEFDLVIEKGLVKEELKVKGIKNELIEKYFNDLGLSQEGKEKWITDYFNENNIQDKLRDNLVKQEEFLEVLENKFYIDYDIEMLKDQIECFGKGEASDYYGNYYENDLSEEEKKLEQETEKRMEAEFNSLNEQLKLKEIEVSKFDNRLNNFVETVGKNIDKFEKVFNIEYNSRSEIEINANEILNSDIEKMEVLKDRIDKENRLGRDQSKDCRIDYGILKTFSERFNEKVELLDKLGINHSGIEKIDKEEIVKYSEKAKFPEVGEVKIFKSESMHFKENQILTFNEANSLFEKEEAYVRDLKREYEKKGEYYPYEKVKGEVKINDNVDFEFRYDIGEGEFYNLADLLERKLSNTNHQYAIKDFLIEKGVRENDKEERGINDIVINLNYEKEEELER